MQAFNVQHFMASLPNTRVRMFDFNLAENFNPAAIAKLLISVFPINGTLFYFGNLYAILDKLTEAGVSVQWHRNYNTLVGLTGYVVTRGTDAMLTYVAEDWGYRFDRFTDFDPTSFGTVVPVTADYLSQGLTAAPPPAAASDPGPSSV